MQTLLLPVIAFILTSCATGETSWIELKPEQEGTGPTLRITGTIQYMDLEGGLFVIRDAKGTRYNPINLPQNFRVDGMAVEVDARHRTDMASIGMVGPIVELLRIRKREDVDVSVAGLSGTSWRLEDLAGAGVLDRVEATLEFADDSKVSGNGSCNRFRGAVTISGAAVRFGPLATTRKSCVEAVMHQESQYLAALQKAQRFEIKRPFLYIFAADRPEPLRFIGAEESGGAN